jgi:hypothetical protein
VSGTKGNKICHVLSRIKRVNQNLRTGVCNCKQSDNGSPTQTSNAFFGALPLLFYFILKSSSHCAKKTLLINYASNPAICPIRFYHSQAMKEPQGFTEGNHKIKVNDVWGRNLQASCFSTCLKSN